MSCTQKQQLVSFPKVRIWKPWFRHFNDHKDFHNEGTVHLFSLMALFSYANFRSNERVLNGERYMEAPGQWICTECWFCETLPKMKSYMEQTVMCEGKPYYAVGGQLCRYPKFVPEDYVLLKLTPCGYEDKWYRWEQEMPPGSPKALIRAAREFSALKIGYRGDLAFRNAEVINVPKFLTEGIVQSDSVQTTSRLRDMVQPQTVEELLKSYPNDYFQLMTPCGFVDLTPSETEKLLRGEATMAHPGVSGCQMPVEAQEILEMEVWSLKRDEHGRWYALVDYPPQQMEQAPQEPQMTM